MAMCIRSSLDSLWTSRISDPHQSVVPRRAIAVLTISVLRSFYVEKPEILRK